MDLKARKIAFIEEFLKLQSEEVISRFEQLLSKEKSLILGTMTEEELNQRVEQSEKDFQENKFKTGEDILKKYS